MRTIYTTKKKWKDGTVTKSNIWASKRSIAEKWARQEIVNELIDEVTIIKKRVKN